MHADIKEQKLCKSFNFIVPLIHLTWQLRIFYFAMPSTMNLKSTCCALRASEMHFVFVECRKVKRWYAKCLWRQFKNNSDLFLLSVSCFIIWQYSSSLRISCKWQKSNLFLKLYAQKSLKFSVSYQETVSSRKAIVTVIFKLLKHHSKVNCRAPAYSWESDNTAN